MNNLIHLIFILEEEFESEKSTMKKNEKSLGFETSLC